MGATVRTVARMVATGLARVLGARPRPFSHLLILRWSDVSPLAESPLRQKILKQLVSFES
jgi:hypothetical protein